MIKLENIAVYGADKFFSSWIEKMGVQELKFIKEKELKNFAQLKKMIIQKEEVSPYFIKLFELTVNYINKDCMINKTSKIWTSNNLQNINQEDLEVTEEQTLAKNLILNAVIDAEWRVTFLDIENLNMQSVRFFLKHTTPNGENSLKLFPRIGNDAVKKVIKAFDYYEEQIKRQAKENHEIGTDLFALNKEAKQEIVKREIVSYIEYLLSFQDDFIWGRRGKNVNDLLKECIISTRKRAIRSRNNLIATLTNYMTLEELENGAVENHTLDRFMLKKTIKKEEK